MQKPLANQYGACYDYVPSLLTFHSTCLDIHGNTLATVKKEDTQKKVGVDGEGDGKGK
jgi:hypothetical protein